MRDNFDQKDNSEFRDCPSGKTCFTKKEAQTALNQMSHSHSVSTAETSLQRRKIKNRPKRIYKCDQCKWWHLTGKNKS